MQIVNFTNNEMVKGLFTWRFASVVRRFVNPFSPLCHTCLVQNQLKKNTDCNLMCDRLYLYEIIKFMLDRFFTVPYFNVVFYPS